MREPALAVVMLDPEDFKGMVGSGEEAPTPHTATPTTHWLMGNFLIGNALSLITAHTAQV